MGKGSDKGSNSNGTATKSRLFKWEEIQKHNKQDDCWIVVNDSVYDVTNFMKKHPGGGEIMNLYAGQYATEVFNAFHTELDKVEKYKKVYHIGQVDPSDMVPNDRMSKEERAKVVRRNAIRKDFEDLRQMAIEKGLFKPSVAFFTMYALQILVCHIAGYWVLLKYGCTFNSVLVSAVLLILSQIQSAWNMHDFSHSAVTTVKLDRLFHLIQMGILKGATACWWTDSHRLHHAKTNVIDKDPDIGHWFLIFSPEQARSRAKKMAAGEEKLYFPFNLQHYFFPIVSFGLFPLYFTWDGLYYGISRKAWVDTLFIIPFYIYHFGITNAVFGSWWKSIAFYLLVRSFESAWFLWPSQSSHIPMDKIASDEVDTWLELQLISTCDYEKSTFNDWYTGHLNFQIEHHLFPTMPRHNLYKIQPYVRDLCQKHGIKYVYKPLLTAFKDLLRSNQIYGAIWKDTYLKLTSEKNK